MYKITLFILYIMNNYNLSIIFIILKIKIERLSETAIHFFTNLRLYYKLNYIL